MSKILLVSSAVQAALLNQVFIPELTGGTAFGPRPAGHGEIWRDVEVKVSKDGNLGPVGFNFARNYNFLNPAFAVPNADLMVKVAQSVKETMTLKSVKKELTELSRIVGGRQVDRDSAPVKLFRGNHKDGTITVSSAKARAAGKALAAAVEATAAKPTAAKKTTVKKAATPAAKTPAPAAAKKTTTAAKKAPSTATKKTTTATKKTTTAAKKSGSAKTTTKRVAVTA